MDAAALGRDADLLGPAVGDGADVAVREAHLVAGRLAGLVDLGDRVGQLEIQQIRRALEAFGMLRQLEDFAAVHTLAFEDRSAVMKRVGQDVSLGFAPRDEVAVHPDPAVAIIEGNERH